MKRIFLLSAIFLVPVFSFADWSEHEISHESGDRSFRVFTPSKKKNKFPALILLHGGGGEANSMQVLSDFAKQAEQDGLLLALPNGLKRAWNDGRPEMKNQVNDESFLLALKKELVKKFKADAKHVSVAGISNGGLMTLRLLCRQSREFYSFASVSASLGEEISKKCSTKSPARILLISGDKDPLMPFEGGQVTGPFGFTKRGKVSGIEKTIEFFRQKLGCSSEATISLIDTDPKDETSVEKSEYSCTKGSRIKLVKIKGGGHAWAGGQQYLPEKVIGKTSREVSATVEIAEFLKEQE